MNTFNSAFKMSFLYHVLLKYSDTAPANPDQLRLFNYTPEKRKPISVIELEVDPTVTDEDCETRMDGAVNLYPLSDPGPVEALRWVFPDLSMVDGWEEMTPEHLAEANYGMFPFTLSEGRKIYKELLNQGYEPAPSCPLP